MFTDGKDRFYENLMQQTPSKKPKHSGRQKSKGLHYKYADLACDYCKYRRRCKYKLCPYIMDWLDHLIDDDDFIRAIAKAESCQNGHRQTLLHIKREGLEELL